MQHIAIGAWSNVTNCWSKGLAGGGRGLGSRGIRHTPILRPDQGGHDIELAERGPRAFEAFGAGYGTASVFPLSGWTAPSTGCSCWMPDPARSLWGSIVESEGAASGTHSASRSICMSCILRFLIRPFSPRFLRAVTMETKGVEGVQMVWAGNNWRANGMFTGSARVQRWSTARDWTRQLIYLRYLIESVTIIKAGSSSRSVNIRWRCNSRDHSMDMLEL